MSEEEKKPDEKINRLIKKIEENSNSLHAKRVPRKTLIQFKELANKEFCGDYGMLIKWFMDGIITQETVMLLDRIQELEQRIGSVESLFSSAEAKEEEEATIKMMDGSKRKVKK